MGLLDAAIRGRAFNQGLPRYAAESAGRVQGYMDRNQILKVGDALMKWPDKSPQGLQKFAQTHNIPFNTMHSVVKLMGDFQKSQRDIAGPDVPMFRKDETGDIIKRKVRPGKIESMTADKWRLGDITPAKTTAPKVPTLKLMENIYGNQTYHEYVPGNRSTTRWIDTGMKPGEKPERKKTVFEIRKDLTTLRMAHDRFVKTGGMSPLLQALLSRMEGGNELVENIKKTPTDAEKHFKEQEDYLTSLLPGYKSQPKTKPIDQQYQTPNWEDFLPEKIE